MQIIIKNLKYVTTHVITELDKYADKEQIKSLVKKALLNHSLIGDIEVK